ncbi:MAG: hypothetical protein H7Z40_18250 [Phycisphaerae bacterium]|nr:hypothetical protein [Gemmatimonadaceae bacterium]
MRARLTVACAEIALAVVSTGLASRTAVSQTLPKISFARPEWTSEASFTQLSGMRELTDGRVIVADYQEAEVHLIGVNGKTIAPIGGKGSGPGEYQMPMRLIPLAGDTTLLVDSESRRYLLINKAGKVVATQRFPASLGDDLSQIKGTDAAGRLIFRVSPNPPKPGARAEAAIGRWQRGRQRFDTVTMISVDSPKPELFTAGADDEKQYVGRVRVRFAPVDDWVVAPSGRLAIIHAIPYRVDWLDANRTLVAGEAVTYAPVTVTEADRKNAEPKGPPFVRSYARVKAAFVPECAIPDDMDNIWVPRYEMAGAATRRWDVFSRTGKHLGTVPLASDRMLLAITKRYAYAVRTDDDGLRWIERYAR